MYDLTDKRVVVIGLGLSGMAACDLLVRRGARVTAIDQADHPGLRESAQTLRQRGVAVILGATAAPVGAFDLAVLSPGFPTAHPLVGPLMTAGVPAISELELGYRQALCLNLAISGTNGKTTTTELIERVLTHCGRKTLAAGNIGLPVCAVCEQTADLDYLTLEVSSFQLETIRYFRPAVAVLLNITPDHLDRYPTMTEYARAKARLFQNQQPFDWAIVQTEALAQLQALKITIPAKVITFSANSRRADIYYDRGLLISRLDDWRGPLLNMDECQLRGPHNAENLMAALAVGRVLRIPLEQMLPALKAYAPPPHRCELVAEINGVKYINDSKATNVDALAKALMSAASEGAEPNVWLLAGGRDKGFDFHDVGPLLSRRVKGALLLGETREKLRSAWSLFVPCWSVDSLEAGVHAAAEKAVPGDTVLLSPACSSFDMFRDYRHRGEVFRQAVAQLTGAASGGSAAPRTPTATPPGDRLLGILLAMQLRPVWCSNTPVCPAVF